MKIKKIKVSLNQLQYRIRENKVRETEIGVIYLDNSYSLCNLCLDSYKILSMTKEFDKNKEVTKVAYSILEPLNDKWKKLDNRIIM